MEVHTHHYSTITSRMNQIKCFPDIKTEIKVSVRSVLGEIFAGDARLSDLYVRTYTLTLVDAAINAFARILSLM